MSRKFLFPSFALLLVVISCGPAAEDRQRMHDRAKVFQDSIANFIHTSMAEAEAPANTAVMVDTATARKNAQAAAIPAK